MVGLKKIASIFLVVLCFGRLQAQEDCELTLSRAVEEFNAGHFTSITSILEPCLRQFTPEQRQRAHLLLTQTSLLLDDPLKARQNYLQVLMANPEFQADTTALPIDVIYLSKKFTATPMFSWSLRLGANTSSPRVIYDLNGFGDSTVTEKYSLKVGYQAGFGWDYNFFKNASLRGEMIYSQTSYAVRTTDYFTFDKKVFTDRQNWLSMPLSLLYSDGRGKYRPYGYVGYAVQYLLSDKGNIVITNNQPSANAPDQSDFKFRENRVEESPTLDLTYKRNRWNQSLVIGAGLKIKVGLDFVFMEARYNVGMKNVVNRQGTYGDNTIGDMTSDAYIRSLEASTRYVHVDDYFRLDNLSFSIGFLKPLYKPRELRKARIRSVVKQMKGD